MNKACADRCGELVSLLEMASKKTMLMVMGALSLEIELLDVPSLEAVSLQVAARGIIVGDGNAEGGARRCCQWRCKE